MDYDEYTFNLTEANLKPNKPPNWFKLYSFKEAYGLNSMKYEEFENLIKQMTTNVDVMKKYYRWEKFVLILY